MATLTAKKRNALGAGTFGLPSRRAYPMPDKSHAANAKARASQQVGKSITPSQKATIDAKANRILGKGTSAASTSLLASKGKRK